MNANCPPRAAAEAALALVLDPVAASAAPAAARAHAWRVLGARHRAAPVRWVPIRVIHPHPEDAA